MSQPCGNCGGDGSVDSGGFTPWGQPIDIPCPACNGRGVQSNAVTALMIATKDHHPACGCGPCLALSGWDEQDELRALAKEKEVDDEN